MVKRAILIAILLTTGSFCYASINSMAFTGLINKYTNQDKKLYRITSSDLEKMSSTSFITSTNFTPKEEFTGVLVKDVLNQIGATGKKMHVICYDGYSYILDVQQLENYGAIFAYKRNGKLMTLQNLGPVAIIFPRDKYPRILNTADINAKTMWQVKSIEITN